jgi:hypothetical protein
MPRERQGLVQLVDHHNLHAQRQDLEGDALTPGILARTDWGAPQ